MAGCTGSRLGRLIVLAVAMTATTSTMAQVPAPAAPASEAPVDPGRNTQRQTKKMDTKMQLDNHPDAALIEYLGEYGDAADGLDPMGLADPAAPLPKSGDGKG